MSTALATKPLRQVANVQELLVNDMARKQLSAVADATMRPERMMRLMAGALRTTPKLGECEPLSLLGAMMTCASLGLEPNTVLGHAYLIPFEESKWNPQTRQREKLGVNVQLIIGYKGMIDMAWRGGRLASIHADVVYENDEFSFEYGSNQHLRHVPVGNRGEPTHAYCHVMVKGGGEMFGVLPYAEVLRIRDMSQGYQRAMATAQKYGKPPKGPWIEHEHAMARKTAVRAIFHKLPVSGDVMASALEVDERRADFGAFAMDPTAGAAFASPDDDDVIEGTVTQHDDDGVVTEGPPPPPPAPRAAARPAGGGRTAQAYADMGAPSPETMAHVEARRKEDAERQADMERRAAEREAAKAAADDGPDEFSELAAKLTAEFEAASKEDDVDEVYAIYEQDLANLKAMRPEAHEEVMEASRAARARLGGA